MPTGPGKAERIRGAQRVGAGLMARGAQRARREGTYKGQRGRKFSSFFTWISRISGLVTAICISITWLRIFLERAGLHPVAPG